MLSSEATGGRESAIWGHGQSLLHAPVGQDTGGTAMTGSSRPYMCQNKNRPRCKAILQNSNLEISQIGITLGIFGSFCSICKSAEGFDTASADQRPICFSKPATQRERPAAIGEGRLSTRPDTGDCYWGA